MRELDDVRQWSTISGKKQQLVVLSVTTSSRQPFKPWCKLKYVSLYICTVGNKFPTGLPLLLPNSAYDGTGLGNKDVSARYSGDKPNEQQKRGIQMHQDGKITNIPGGMVTDQFGMVGLLTFIKAAETDPNLVALALGSDL
ncbi:uncharacterized protein LOC144354111, partial [Saccoglossus kowalevskii]